ncbi:hypothetical protein PR202_ga25722 [Eleusine coracana subsp. coracana]|uniref:Annexin n=1 Tax=Eleusine coracana subsp. coracana TaxID=191504 RepID=A0AAV5DAV3_ELECO|nr:hypothetical protein PR202_ga25722 [Eleusine coracana subsp. coracana]
MRHWEPNRNRWALELLEQSFAETQIAHVPSRGAGYSLVTAHQGYDVKLPSFMRNESIILTILNLDVPTAKYLSGHVKHQTALLCTLQLAAAMLGVSQLVLTIRATSTTTQVCWLPIVLLPAYLGALRGSPRGSSRELAGEPCLQEAVKCLDAPANYFAEVISAAFKDDADKQAKAALTRVVVSRAEADMDGIRDAYAKQHGAKLVDAVAKNTHGHYRDALLAMIGK